MDSAQAGMAVPAPPRPPVVAARMHRIAAFDAPVLREVDVLVVGGGPAGVAAAVAAARAGSSVLLAEHYGFLGGAHASGEIGTFAGLYHTDSQEDVPRFMGRGLARSLLGALRGATSGPRPQAALTGPQRWFNTWVEVYDPVWLRICIDRMVRAAGVEVLLHATAVDAIRSGRRVEGALFATKAGLAAVKARFVVDASGDADIVARAGGSFRMGEDGLLMHPTMLFRMFGVDTERLRYLSWSQIAEIMRRDGPDYGLNRFFPGVFLGTREGEVLINATKQVRADGTSLDMLDPWDRTHAEFEGREACVRYERFFRERLPGFEKARINVLPCSVAVRETRLIDGEYRLTGADVLTARRFADAVAASAWPMEKMEGDSVELTWLPDGRSYEVPMRSLIPKGLEGIVVAGRCLSAERAAHASARTWALCMDLGEAAGRAAALALASRRDIREIDIGRLQDALAQPAATH